MTLAGVDIFFALPFDPVFYSTLSLSSPSSLQNSGHDARHGSEDATGIEGEIGRRVGFGGAGAGAGGGAAAGAAAGAASRRCGISSSRRRGALRLARHLGGGRGELAGIAAEDALLALGLGLARIVGAVVVAARAGACVSFFRPRH